MTWLQLTTLASGLVAGAQVGAPDCGDPDANSSNRAHADGLG